MMILFIYHTNGIMSCSKLNIINKWFMCEYLLFKTFKNKLPTNGVDGNVGYLSHI